MFLKTAVYCFVNSVYKKNFDLQFCKFVFVNLYKFTKLNLQNEKSSIYIGTNRHAAQNTRKFAQRIGKFANPLCKRRKNTTSHRISSIAAFATVFATTIDPLLGVA